MNKEIIKLSNISKKFTVLKKNITVLKNINLKINRGELISLTGPSGSGKSTLLHIIALLDQPSNGEVFFKEKSLTKSKEYEKDLVRKKGISIIYQQNNLLTDFTALENVIIPLLNNDIDWNSAKKKALKFL
jgi:ABC-type lipoprotein export system ATPase subunit